MSDDTTHPHHLPPSSTDDDVKYYSVKDVMMWRRKRVSVGVLTTVTVLWVVMEIYGYNFITVASWIAIFLFSSLFAWANIFMLIYKEEPSMSTIGISESTATETASWIKKSSEDGMRWVFKVGAQSEWYVFVAAIVGLWLLSIVGSSTDLITLLFIGTVVGMSVPVTWKKYDYKIREHGRRLQMHSKRFYSMLDYENVLQKLKSKVKLILPANNYKEKKVE